MFGLLLRCCCCVVVAALVFAGRGYGNNKPESGFRPNNNVGNGFDHPSERFHEIDWIYNICIGQLRIAVFNRVDRVRENQAIHSPINGNFLCYVRLPLG